MELNLIFDNHSNRIEFKIYELHRVKITIEATLNLKLSLAVDSKLVVGIIVGNFI